MHTANLQQHAEFAYFFNSYFYFIFYFLFFISIFNFYFIHQERAAGEGEVRETRYLEDEPRYEHLCERGAGA